ncbi:hypothetical protein FPD38_07430 [Campylobacter volucris]|uniref:Uncharacterized protein n=1 Tax=Campylobacter volucris TaxID=1031542 RepID=A0A5C7DSD6_9BACT|nr:type II restriction endonuclease [Campylobacter volucris]TXE85809.1 hypothetical protein FPD38_07430 [Campylobacter volucris]
MSIDDKKFDINLKFYFFMKYLVKINFSDTQMIKILYDISKNENSLHKLKQYINLNTKNGLNQWNYLEQIIYEIRNNIDFDIFIFSLKIYSIKNLLLELAKIKQISNAELLLKLDPLSLEYDKITIYNPYSTRVNGALLALTFFNHIDNNQFFHDDMNKEYFLSICHLSQELKKHGLEPNQIFMLIFNESINQSIISYSGNNYENRILQKLQSIGINQETIAKKHDENDSSTEFDFFFNFNGKSYGIGAKRTLRERYKQFIKTSQMSKIDVMIEITLGLDLSEEKAKAIRNHGVYLIVSDEIYKQNEYLQNMKGISSSQLTLELLQNL